MQKGEVLALFTNDENWLKLHMARDAILQKHFLIISFFMNYPQMVRLRQAFVSRGVDDICAKVNEEIAKLSVDTIIQPKQSVAVGVGSRGIDNHALILKCLLEELKKIDAEPFIVPAMGSHGGATAEGQTKVLENLGISEATMGVPVCASMDTVQLGVTEFGMPVYFDYTAAKADHIVLLNRIKPHTRFTAPFESGLLKMLAIGFGKKIGAQIYHKNFVFHGFERVVRGVYEVVKQSLPIAFGLGIIENGYQKTADIRAIRGDRFDIEEPELMKLARAWCPQLPFRNVDLLLIDEFGKDISGAGMDTSVTGLKRIFCPEIADQMPRVDKIFVRDLTPASKGNAMGIGLADVTTKRLIERINFTDTYTNAFTGQNLRGAKLPIYLETDRQVLDMILPFFAHTVPEQVKVVWIKNTLQLAEVEVSSVYLDEIGDRSDLSVIGEPLSLYFDQQHNLPPINQFRL